MVKDDSPSACWVLQMTHQTKMFPDPSGNHVIFSDNFYTRHILASSLKAVTEGEYRLIGTVRFSNVETTNHHYLKTAIQQLKESLRGSWLIVCAYDKVGNYDQ
jgi:hypothetical protein